MGAVLIGNPNAGRKGGLSTNVATVDDAVAALRSIGLAPDVWLTTAPGHAAEHARHALGTGYELVIAAGGDGTIHEVAGPLVNTDVTLGIMPLGSVMNLARTLGIPRDLGAAARIIAARNLVHMDVGLVNGRHFLEYAGVGIDAALTPLLNQIDSGRWWSLGDLFRVAFRYRPIRMVISVDGRRTTVKALMVVVANTPYYGAGFELSPDAEVDDRRFDVTVFDRFSRWELIRYGWQIYRGRRPYHPSVHRMHGRSVAISTSRPLPAHADTYLAGTTPLRFQLLPGALAVAAGPTVAHRHTTRVMAGAGNRGSH